MRETPVTVEELIHYLDRRGAAWTNSATLTIDLQTDKRTICKMADEAEGRIISGVNGYKLQDHATRDEVMAAYKHLTDLIDALQARCSALMTRYHRREKEIADKNQMSLF
jgi:hypothetical protein